MRKQDGATRVKEALSKGKPKTLNYIQAANRGKRLVTGPVTTEVFALLGWGACFKAQLDAELATEQISMVKMQERVAGRAIPYAIV